MTTIIIEDEKPSARRLARLLADLGVEVTTMLHSVEESIDWFKGNEHPDLIFFGYLTVRRTFLRNIRCG